MSYPLHSTVSPLSSTTTHQTPPLTTTHTMPHAKPLNQTRQPHKAIRKDGRPLPVSAVSHSPGPAYSLPSELGKGPKVTFKLRYVRDEELLPMPGPGEYEPKEAVRWSTAPGFSFGGKQAHEAKASQKSLLPDEPGPGDYTTPALTISKNPTVRSGWRMQEVNKDDPKNISHPGCSIGGPAQSAHGAGNVPGPGHYTPRADNKGCVAVGATELQRASGGMRQPGKSSEKRADDTAAPGPGAYDTTRFDIAKQVCSKPTSMAPRPFEVDVDEAPGPGSYEIPSFASKPKGPRFTPAPPRKPDRSAGPGPGEYFINRELTPRGGGVTMKHRPTPSARSSKCPHQKGDLVSVQVSRTGPRVKGTVKEIWCCDDPGVPAGYSVVLENGTKREVDGTQVCKWEGGVGPGAYDPSGGIGKNGPRHTIQGPCQFTSMAVSESRKTRDNPGPSQYFKDGALPKSTGEGVKAKIGNRLETKQANCDVGPGGGPSGNYEPRHPSTFKPYGSFSPGVSLAGKAQVKLTVRSEADQVRKLCEEAGITEWKGGKEWRANRSNGEQVAESIDKDTYCGREGVFIQQRGIMRARGGATTVGPNRNHNKSQPYAPWASYSNKSKSSIRVKFQDGTCWNYPPTALLRHGLAFDKANERWPAPQTVCDGGPSATAAVEKASSPKISIGGRPVDAVTELTPGPGQYNVPSGLKGRGAVIGTGQ